MSDEKMVTEREAVRREREAVDRATEFIMRQLRDNVASWDSGGTSYTSCRSIARRFVEEQDFRNVVDAICRKPIQITRPRVVRDTAAVNDPFEFRVLNGRIEERRAHGRDWIAATNWTPTSARVALWADLLANPTEEVEAE